MEKYHFQKVSKSFRIAVIIACSIFLSFLSFFFLHNRGIISGEALKVSDFISLIISTLALGSGGVAVWLSYESLKHTQKAEEGQLYLTMMKRYSSAEMVRALRLLSDLRKEKGDDFESYLVEWDKQRKNNDAAAMKVEDARHLVKYFYRDLMQMVQAEYFSEELAVRICNTGGRHVFWKVILPMDKVMNNYQYEGEFDPFKDIYKKLNEAQKNDT